MPTDRNRCLCPGRNYAKVPSDGTRQALGGGVISPKVERRTGHSFSVTSPTLQQLERFVWGQRLQMRQPVTQASVLVGQPHDIGRQSVLLGKGEKFAQLKVVKVWQIRW